VVLGGDHAISFPVVRGFEEPINLIHLDSHLDFRQFVYGITMSNGHPIRRIAELPNVRQIVQIGIRGLRISQEDWEAALQRGNRIITASQFKERGVEEVLNRVPKGGKTYVTIDIDVLDSPIIPGCASAEIGGLSYDELRRVLFGIAARTQVVGFDVVEVNPILDMPARITSLWAAQLILEFIGQIVLHPDYLKGKDRVETS
jgi:agmatinase